MENDFIVQDQLLMEKAGNYNAWLFSLILPYLGSSVLEIGSGNGNITAHILRKPGKVKALTCVEQNPNCSNQLKKTLELINTKAEVEILNQDFMEMMQEKTYDTVFSLNVLEHLKDDLGALEKMNNLLVPGGKLVCVVPAMRGLYGSMDKKLKHYRRYSKADLLDKINLAGFKPVKLRYYNLFGFFGWFFNNRILKIQSQSSRQILFFDQHVQPLQAWVESKINLPFGQSLFLVALKK